jgi:hypothetical protein
MDLTTYEGFDRVPDATQDRGKIEGILLQRTIAFFEFGEDLKSPFK